MKTFRRISICLLFVFVFVISLLPINFAHADTTVYRPPKISNTGKFTLSVQANNRLSNVELEEDIRELSPYESSLVKYYCFKWRDLNSLNLQVTSNINANMEERYDAIHLKVTYLQSDNLLNPIGTEPQQNLYDYAITGNSFPALDFYYYIDGDSAVPLTPTSAKGNGYGLYKFDLIYDYYDPLTMQDETQISSILEATYYLAVIPDKIDEIELPKEIRISSRVSSSKRLMNTYLFSLTSNAFRYVNPAYLEWQVIGQDTMKQSYCRDNLMKNSSNIYTNFDVIRPAYNDYNGDTFLLDTNDIEGTWQVTCILKYSSGDVTLTAEEVSTIKSPTKNYLWLIWLVLGIMLLLAAVICVIIIVKNRTSEKVW